MPYQVTISIGDFENLTPRAAAESAFMELLLALFHGPCEMSVRNTETGEVTTVEFGPGMEDDQTMIRYVGMTIVASKFLSEEQRREMEQWESENLDGHSVASTDWPGWEALIGKKPKKFRNDMGLE